MRRVKCLRLDLPNGLTAIHAGAIDEDIDGAEFVRDALNERLERFDLLDFAGKRRGAPAALFDLHSCSFEALLGSSREGDPSPGHCERVGQLASNSAARARYQRDAPIKREKIFKVGPRHISKS